LIKFDEFSAIIWYHNNKPMINSEDCRILTNNNKSILIINNIKREDYGYYACKALNDAGETYTRAQLIESTTSSMLSQEDLENLKKKVSKRAEGKARTTSRRLSRAKKSDVRSSVKSKDVSTSHSVSFNKEESVEYTKSSTSTSFIQTTSTLKVTTKEDTIIQEIQGSSVTELDHKVSVNVYDYSNIETLKSSQGVSDIFEKMKSKGYGENDAIVKDLAAITFLSQQGMSMQDISSLYQTNNFPALQIPEAQSALVQLLEREGYGRLVSEVLTEEADEKYVATAGFRAFMKMAEIKQQKIEEIISLLSPEDFVSHEWKNSSEVQHS
jgi:hypothetical protein